MINSKSQVMTAGLTTQRKIIKGVVSINGIPASRLVRIYAGIGGRFLAQKLSLENGQYSFVLPSQPSYTIVAIDHKHQFNAVIQDNVVPK